MTFDTWFEINRLKIIKDVSKVPSMYDIVKLWTELAFKAGKEN